MKLMVYHPMGRGSQTTTSLSPQALEFAEGCSLLTDHAQSKRRHTNLAALLWVPLVSMDSHVQEVLVGGYFSTQSISKRTTVEEAALGFPAQGRQGHTGESPATGRSDGSGIEAAAVPGKAGRSGTV